MRCCLRSRCGRQKRRCKRLSERVRLHCGQRNEAFRRCGWLQSCGSIVYGPLVLMLARWLNQEIQFLQSSRSSVCSKAQYAQMLSMLKAQPRSSTNLYRILDKTQSRNSRTTSCRSNKVQMSPNRELRAKTKSLWFQQVNNSGSASSQSRCQSRNTRALKPEMIKRINARCPWRYRRRHKANAPSEKCRCTV